MSAGALHAHPDCVVVSLSEYQVRNVIPGQSSVDRHSRTVDVRWIPAIAHTGENAGTTEMRGLLIVLKR